ncbi:hypothetical protein E3E11_03250 [Oecophyllibacter saccharovorans]|uniref:hypothetical protein n=1 Tax=Oecophyllibacter saccharovorans TaxID=2558360 RepID=UPI0011647BEB|nr:hypothetical protein [Oecophyllibacter saccharovorans]QDH15044.1 hypothetical protein E3E11_03250 [Oecophyllibacter saccharovorans]
MPCRAGLLGAGLLSLAAGLGLMGGSVEAKPPAPIPLAPPVKIAQAGPWQLYRVPRATPAAGNPASDTAACMLTYTSRMQARTPLVLSADARELSVGSQDPADDFSPNEVEKLTVRAGSFDRTFRVRGTETEPGLMRGRVRRRWRAPLLDALGSTLTVSVQINNQRPHPLKMIGARPLLDGFRQCARQAGFLKALGEKPSGATAPQTRAGNKQNAQAQAQQNPGQAGLQKPAVPALPEEATPTLYLAPS